MSAANLRENHLYLTGHADFFPADAFGPSSSKAGTGKPLRLDVEGLAESVFTDIPTDARTGKPRKFFRKRAWVGEFFARHGIKPGDTIAIERIGTRRFRVLPFDAKEERQCPTTFDFSGEPEGDGRRVVGRSPHAATATRHAA